MKLIFFLAAIFLGMCCLDVNFMMTSLDSQKMAALRQKTVKTAFLCSPSPSHCFQFQVIWNLRWEKHKVWCYTPNICLSPKHQPVDEMPLPFTIRRLQVFSTLTCETSIWLPDIWSTKSWHPQTILSPAQSLVTHSVWAAGPLHPHHNSSLHHKLSN